VEWALTAFVLGSVSALVVTLTMEQGGQAIGRNGFTLSRGRSLLHRALLSTRVLGIGAGRQVRSAGETAVRRVGALTVSLGHAAGVAVRSRVGFRDRVAATVPRRGARRKRRSLKFEECLQTTGPEVGLRGEAGPALSVASLPASTGWFSRALAVFELVAVIAVAGGAIALTVIAVGWKAARLF
jgi:hypothetical protein